MTKFVMVLVFSFLLGGVATAQMSKNDLTAKREAYWKTIDTKTAWGKWLSTEFRPYEDQLANAVMLLVPPENAASGKTPQDLVKENHARYAECFEALQKITP